MEKLEKLSYDTIILGGTLEALIHSYVEGLPLIMVNPQIPFFKDFDPTGLNKSDAWKRLSFHLSYAGLNPFEQKADSYRLEEDNTISIFGKSPYKIEIKYNNIIRYDQIEPTEKMRVLDKMRVEKLLTSNIPVVKTINTGEDFINHFIPNITRNTEYVAAVSYLTQQQLAEEQYGETYARLKATDVLIKNGIVGLVENLKNGGKKLHRIKTHIIKREILLDHREKEDKLLLERRQTKNPYLKSVLKLFGDPYRNIDAY